MSIEYGQLAMNILQRAGSAHYPERADLARVGKFGHLPQGDALATARDQDRRRRLLTRCRPDLGIGSSEVHSSPVMTYIQTKADRYWGYDVVERASSTAASIVSATPRSQAAENAEFPMDSRRDPMID